MPTDTVPEERAIRGGELPALTTNSQVYLAQSPLNLPGRLVEEESVEYKQKEEIQEEGDIVTINCGGFVHMVDAALFRPYPGTLLHNMFSLGEGDRGHVKKRYDSEGRVFLDRHPLVFVEVLTFYRQKGKSHPPSSVHSTVWEEELMFFGLYHAVKTQEMAERNLDVTIANPRDIMMPPKPGCRQTLWKLLEDPQSSNCARLLSMISLVAILASVGGSVIETLYDSEFYPDVGLVEMPPPPAFYLLETVCIIYFTAEFVLRMCATNRLWLFCTNAMNIIDLIAIIPFYINLMSSNDSGSLSVVRIFRLVRVFRVFKLGRHSSGLAILGRTVSSSLNELLLLLFFLSMGILLFATAIYYVEHGRAGEGLDGKPVFTSIPHSFYWATVTMTTLGYGDVYPMTGGGMLVACICSIGGVVMIALPMVVIGQNFADHYQKGKEAAATAKRLEVEKRALLGVQPTLKSRMSRAFTRAVSFKKLNLSAEEQQAQESAPEGRASAPT